MLLLIDNYDSFTWNLVHGFGQLQMPARVVRNDQITADQIRAERPRAIVISPGPCDPDRAGVSLAAVTLAVADGIPLLGVCLGHQAIGQALGGRIIRAPHPMHGKTSLIAHDGSGVFAGLEQPLRVVRYHSLVVARDSVSADLRVTAWSDDGQIMGLAHRHLPIHGVQFHPESIATQAGLDLLANFLALVRGHGAPVAAAPDGGTAAMSAAPPLPT